MTTIFVDKENTSSITAALVEFYSGKVIIGSDQGILREVEVPLFSENTGKYHRQHSFFITPIKFLFLHSSRKRLYLLVSRKT